MKTALVLLALVAALAITVECYVPVYVMAPLSLIDYNSRQINNQPHLEYQLKQLQNAGADGLMVDVWWGIVEKTGPKQYYWQPYQTLVDLAKKYKLSLSMTMSFHQCGGNVGDNVYIPIPQFVRDAEPKAFYTDREGRINYEYISLGADNSTVFAGRSPMGMYADFITSFRDNVFKGNEGVIKDVTIGLGPAGEWRYPAYLSTSFPGVGEFQCYDPYMLKSLREAANNVGHPEWGKGGPDNAGNYYSQPGDADAAFWHELAPNNYASPYGYFFLNWYTTQLLRHGDAILAMARDIFTGHVYGDIIGAKVAGIHWLYKTPNHAAEVTAGYLNTLGFNGYAPFARIAANHGAIFDFTCLEMFDSDQCSTCAPEELLKQVRGDVDSFNGRFGGENALPFYDERHYDMVLYQSRTPSDIDNFAYLRLTDALVQGDNYNRFKGFVYNMHNQ